MQERRQARTGRAAIDACAGDLRRFRAFRRSYNEPPRLLKGCRSAGRREPAVPQSTPALEIPPLSRLPALLQ